jgi:hypothetical protein
MMGNPCRRAEAERIAREYEAADGKSLDGTEFQAYALDEIKWQRPCLYGVEDLDAALERSWIVYVRQTKLVMLKSSYVVIVSKNDGVIIYAGSAHDEG